MALLGLLEEINNIFEARKKNVRFFADRMPRDLMLHAAMLTSSRGRPRGTAIVAAMYDNGVIMAADRLTVEGSGEVFSRTNLKLDEIEDNAVVATCGLVSFGQEVVEDLASACKLISARIQRSVSLSGKASLFREIIKANVISLPIFEMIGVSFGAIMGGFDTHDGAIIMQFETEGGVFTQEHFAADGSGRPAAKSFFEEHYRPKMRLADAIELVIGAVRAAGKQVITVSHPADPPPNVKVITRHGIIDVPEGDIVRHCHALNTFEAWIRRGLAKKRVSR